MTDTAQPAPAPTEVHTPAVDPGLPSTTTPAVDALTETTALGQAAETPEPVTGATADGPPASAEVAVEPIKYEGLKAPEGFAALNDAALEAASPLLNQLGVKDSAQAQAAIDTFAKEVLPKLSEAASTAAQKAQVEQITAIRKEWLDNAKVDPRFGGAAYDQNITIAAKAIDTFGGPKLREFFNQTGIGNHPDVIDTFVNIGKAIQEGVIHRSDGGEQHKLTAEQVFYGDRYQRKDAAA